MSYTKGACLNGSGQESDLITKCTTQKEQNETWTNAIISSLSRSCHIVLWVTKPCQRRRDAVVVRIYCYFLAVGCESKINGFLPKSPKLQYDSIKTFSLGSTSIKLTAVQCQANAVLINKASES